MKTFFLFAACFSFLAFAPLSASAQNDDIRQATGLPIPIGQPVIYGQVRLDGLDSRAPKPVIFVALLGSGTQIDRVQANDRGYYFFLRGPQNGMSILFEVNGNEVGREQIVAWQGNSFRKDITINWKAYEEFMARKPAVVSAAELYSRSAENEAIFKKALDARKQDNLAEAQKLLNQIVQKDPKDFVAWTELGSLLFSLKKYGEAEIAYGRALEQKPDLMIALMNLGKLYLSQEKFDLAITAFTRAATVDGESADAFQFLGEAYLQRRQGSKAVPAFNEALRLQPIEKAEIHLRLATLYNAAGAKHLASAEYQKFIQKVPNHPEKKKFEKYISDNPIQ